MAFNATISDRISFGNMQLRIYDLTGVQSTGSTLSLGFDNAWGVKALNNSDSSDTFKEAVGSKTSSSTRNQVTFTSVTNDDVGQAWVWVR